MNFTQFFSGLPKPYCYLEISFRDSFITTVAGFQNGFSKSESTTVRAWKAANT
jgi:hypothetical protein